MKMHVVGSVRLFRRRQSLIELSFDWLDGRFVGFSRFFQVCDNGVVSFGNIEFLTRIVAKMIEQRWIVFFEFRASHS